VKRFKMKGYFHLSLTALFIFLFLNPAFADISCTVKDQTDLQLTIYNDNLGLVKDERHISLPDGRFNLKFMDVASKIMPSSI
jgi:hypothetical protein